MGDGQVLQDVDVRTAGGAGHTDLAGVVRAKNYVVYCDVDLSSLTTPQLDEIVDLLRMYDFFYAGLVVYGRAGHDHLRMQAVLAPLDTIEVTDLVLDSSLTREVRQFVLSDRDQFSHLLLLRPFRHRLPAQWAAPRTSAGVVSDFVPQFPFGC